MKDPVSRRFEGRQAEAFLAQIETERATELARLAASAEAEAGRIRRQARAAVRRFHRRTAIEARERFDADHQRKLARAAGEFRRRRWAVLGDLEAAARRAVRDELERRWRTPTHRAAWCRHYFEVAAELGFGASTEVTVGGLAAGDGEQLRPLVDRLGKEVSLVFDPAAEPGIEFRNGALYLDGRLCSQLPGVLDDLAGHYNRWLHQPVAEDGAST